jgi:site-specific recombinase XerD
MSNKPISDLRRRMIEDMTVRSFGEKTQNGYLRHVETLAAFLGRSPDTVTGDDIRQFQLHQVEHGAQPSTLNSQASGLRFFFTITLGRPDLTHQLVRTNYPRKLPRILSPDEVLRLLEAAPGPGLKYKAALSIAYGAGLRVGEIVMLRVSDIDSERMLIPTSKWARAAKIATPCCPSCCWSCCAPGGGNAGRAAGCFRGAIRSCRSPRANSIASATWRRRRRGSAPG